MIACNVTISNPSTGLHRVFFMLAKTTMDAAIYALERFGQMSKIRVQAVRAQPTPAHQGQWA